MNAAIEAARQALESAQERGPDDEGQDIPTATDPTATDPTATDPTATDPTAEHPTEEIPAGIPAAAAAGSASLHRRPASRARASGSRPPRAGSRRTQSSSRRPPPGGASRGQPRRMRGLLVTPWFAAGAGFVIAAALALNSPHTVLTYRPNTLPCSTCVPPAPGSLASAKPGVKLKVPASAKHAPSGRGTTKATQEPAAVAGLQVGFRVVWQKNGAFGALITLPAGHAGHDWKLRFAIPGRRIIQVVGAQWQPSPSGYSGEASMLKTRSGFSEHSAPPDAHQSGGPQTPGQPVRRLGFFVAAQGAPVTPVDCVLNGVACHFG